MNVSGISSVNYASVSAVNAPAPYDPAQQDFLDALKAFEAALAAAKANPNDPVLAVELAQAGKALAAAQTTLAAGTAADKAMNDNFEALTQGKLDGIIKDCASGSIQTIQNDVYALSQDRGTWNTIQEGLNAFDTMYPNS